MDKKIGIAIAAAGALYLLTKKGSPTFYNMQGSAITAATCGTSATFDVPGYKRVWMDQLKNGALNFSGPFDLPMPAYVFNCTNDVGVYNIAVYEIDANGVKGELIGDTTFTIHPRAVE